MRPAFLSATHGPRSKVNLRLGERDELDMLLIALTITKRDKYHLLILGDLAYLCSAVTGLPKSLGALDNRQQRTALVSHVLLPHKGHSAAGKAHHGVNVEQ